MISQWGAVLDCDFTIENSISKVKLAQLTTAGNELSGRERSIKDGHRSRTTAIDENPKTSHHLHPSQDETVVALWYTWLPISSRVSRFPSYARHQILA